MAEPLTALYVRVPTPIAHRLDREAREQGRSKQALVTGMLVDGLESCPSPATDTASAELGDPSGQEVLDLGQTAELLRVSEADVLERWEQGDFPGRRLGPHWRVSRAAVLAWVAGSEPMGTRRAGYADDGVR